MANIVDLTHTVESDIHTYPDDPIFSAEPAFEFPSGDGCRVHALHLGTHTGTHIDAPYHFYKNGKKINEVPLEWLVGRPVVIDISSLVGMKDRFRIEWDHLAIYEEGIRKAGQGDKILLIRTGWDVWFSQTRSNTYLLHPYFSGDVAAKLVEHGIRIFGVDSLSPDRTSIEPAGEDTECYGDDPWAIHHAIHGSGGLIVENLANLQEIIGETPGKEWVIHFIPLKLGGLDGSPIRAYAIQQDQE